MSVHRKESLESRILNYLRTEGYRGMGVMSRDLHVRIENVKWTLNALVFEGKVEPVVYGGIRIYRAKAQKSSEPKTDL